MKWRRLRLSESAEGGRVSQRPIILSSTGKPQASSEAASDWLSFLSPFMPPSGVLHCWFVFFGQAKKMNE
jgi:hypothetical protein